MNTIQQEECPMIVFAVSCHPDDLEFQMAGTLLLLKKAGC
jgi:LmbE family N-acetylglucosaminyl deacetylase